MRDDGDASPGWSGLTAVMVIEKTARRGARLVVPIGVALLVAGAVVAAPAVLGGRSIVEILLLAHEGHQHGPDLGLVALLVAGAVFVPLLLARLIRERFPKKGADQPPPGQPPRG